MRCPLSDSRRAAPQRRHPRGFTLIELGIVIAVVIILAASLLVSVGFTETARVANAAKFVRTLRDAAQAYSQRMNNSASYAGLSAAALVAQGLLPAEAATPWQQAFAVQGGPQNTVNVRMCVASADECSDLADLLDPITPQPRRPPAVPHPLATSCTGGAPLPCNAVAPFLINIHLQ